MLNPDKVHFPMNIVNLLAEAVKDIDPDIGLPNDPNYIEGLRVFKRPLDITDGTESVGVFPSDWKPDFSSKEMGFGKSPVEPTIQRYTVILQGLVIDADEAHGIAVHSLLASELRNVLYRDEALRVVLPQLSVSYGIGGPTEVLKRWDVDNQTFLSNEHRGQFAFLSTVEIRLDTVLN